MALSLKKFLGHSLNYGASDALIQIVGFLLIPLYTRFLTPTDYGILEITTTLAIFLLAFVKMGVPGAVSRYYYDYEDDPEKFKNLITTVAYLLNIGGIIISALVGVVIYFFGEAWFGGVEFWPFIFIALIIANLNSNNQLQKKLILNRLQSRYNMFLQLFIALVNIGLTMFFIVALDMGALGSILGTLIASVLLYIHGWFYLKKDLGGRFDRSMAKDCLRYGSGIIPHHVSNNAGPMVTKSILASIGSLALLGTFSISMRFLTPLFLVATSLNTVMVPTYYSARKKEKDEQIMKLIRQLLIISLVGYAGYLLIAPFLMKWILPPEYHSGIALLPILAIAFIGRTIYHINVVEVIYQKKTRYISALTISGLILNIMVCFLFVKEYEAEAICWAYSINFLVLGISSYIYKRAVSNFNRFNKEVLLFLSLTTVISVIGFYIS